ncbi:MAG: hypothetical protein COV52_09830 [Gammaproteobacteria bacterium CG11_big_fil_rev_8_21_14_0_20_46_22]|nr:MAG: hypothetical protein COV52_09830 [Gammaproteobacteria bacterium CG11_big_fil_rev_8_21_14_0_20_46_22]
MTEKTQGKSDTKALIELESPIIDHKISQLIAESIALEQEEAENNGAVSYMARALVQACMPHKKPEEFYFKRKNGHYSLVMTSNPDIGLPYGSIPRLIMIWITSEVVKKKSRELILGHSLSAFMSELGIPRTGAYIERFKDQTKRLFSCAISCTYDDGNTWQVENVRTVKRASLTWAPQKEDDPKTHESILLLDQDFFDEILSKPVPIDLNVIKKLKNSSLALDIYCWLTYRMSYLRKMTPIPWESLHNQFGSNYAKDKSGRYAFKKRFTDQMVKILALYPDANVKKEQKGLTLYPSKTHIKKQPAKALNTTTSTAQKDNSEPSSKDVKKYDSYRLNTLVDIVEQKLNGNDKKKLLADFNEYITRRQLKWLYTEVKSGFQTREAKQHLYDFINSRWHHLLDPIDSFADFVKKDAEKETV